MQALTQEEKYYKSLFIISSSQKTVNTYKTAINHFRNFLLSNFNKNDIELISGIKNNEIDVYELIGDFIIYLSDLQVKPKGMRGYLSGVKGYLRHCGIKIDTDDFKLRVKIPKLIHTKEIPLTKEMILKTLHNAPAKLQTTILVAVASGLRIGELVQLKLSDIDFSSNPTKITVRPNTSKTRKGRITFLTTEATNALEDYLSRYFSWTKIGENLDLQDKHIFGPLYNKGRKPKKAGFNAESAKLSLQIILRNHIEKIPELSQKNENGFNSIHFHAFRKYFRTVVGTKCGRDFAETLMGHGFNMDTYYQITDEKAKTMYLDAEPLLTISDFKSVEKNLETIVERCTNLEKTVNELRNLMDNHSIPIPTFLKTK